MFYDVVSKTWAENLYIRESYIETWTIEATVDDDAFAHQIAESLVDMWTSVEPSAKRFVNGQDHGAYVENRNNGEAEGIRVSVLPRK